MAKDGHIVRHSVAALNERSARGESLTDLTRIRGKTEDELERDVASDPEWSDVPRDWYLNAVPVVPPAKTFLSIRLDEDIVGWFKQQGPGYQTRINAVLRSFVQQAGKRQD